MTNEQLDALVERLRDTADHARFEPSLHHEAANAIAALRARAEAAEADAERLAEAMKTIAGTEWLEEEPGGNWIPEGCELYVQEMEAFCNWAIQSASATLAAHNERMKE